MPQQKAIAEKSLENTEPLKMSSLTDRILMSIDLEAVKTIRRRNFLTLDNSLKNYNLSKWEMGPESAPLCYPLILDFNVYDMKLKLIKKGIYIPTYWSDAKKRCQNKRIENMLTNCCLPIPCDQRYSDHEVSYIINEIIAALK